MKLHSFFAGILLIIAITDSAAGMETAALKKSFDKPVQPAAISDLDKLVGQLVDIAPSAYQYQADRKAEDNAPESWLALMQFAGQPLNKLADTKSPAIKQVMFALLWEEIQPASGS